MKVDLLRKQKLAVNPYQPPTSVSERIGGEIRSFRVGVNEITTVFVRASVWSGVTTYTQDDAGNLGPEYRGLCRFEVGHREPHEINIEVDDRGRVNVYVDELLVEANLFARLRVRIFVIVGVFIAFVFSSMLLAGWMLL